VVVERYKVQHNIETKINKGKMHDSGIQTNRKKEKMHGSGREEAHPLLKCKLFVRVPEFFPVHTYKYNTPTIRTY